MGERAEKKYKTLKRILGEVLSNLPVETPEDLDAIRRIAEKLYKSESLKDFEKIKIDISRFFREKRLVNLSPKEGKRETSSPFVDPVKRILKTSVILLGDIIGEEKDRFLRAIDGSKTLSDLERLEREIKDAVLKREMGEVEREREVKDTLISSLGASEKALAEMKDALTMFSSHVLGVLKSFLENGEGLGERIEGIREKLQEVESPDDIYILKNEVDDIVFKYYELKELSHREILELKDIVLHLGNTLESFLDATGGFSVRIKDYLEELSKAKTLEEISRIKNAIVKETEKIRDLSISLTQRMKELQEKLTYLQERVRELERSLEETRKKVLTDPLMGIKNRRALKMRLKEMIGLFKRKGKPFTFLMMDIDHFKKINDTYGHSVGDKVLKAMASVIRKTLREYDELFRYGGEEIAAILPETKIEEGVKVAERIRKAVSSVNFVTRSGKFTVTISIGATEVKEGDTEDSIVERADKALYRAKNKGRNRVEVG